MVSLASFALVLALVPPQKFSNGSALCKLKMALPSQDEISYLVLSACVGQAVDVATHSRGCCVQLQHVPCMHSGCPLGWPGANWAKKHWN